MSAFVRRALLPPPQFHTLAFVRDDKLLQEQLQRCVQLQLSVCKSSDFRRDQANLHCSGMLQRLGLPQRDEVHHIR